jgi:hypothetical protein
VAAKEGKIKITVKTTRALLVSGLLALAQAAAAAASGVTIEGNQIRIEMATLSAVFDRCVLVSLVRKSDGRRLIQASAKDTRGVFLVYPGGEAVPQRGSVGDAVPLRSEETDRFTPHRINDHRAEFRIEAWDGDGVMTLSDDPENGDLIVEVEHLLLSRATDENGNRQPLSRDPARFDSYELNWCAPVPCVVR